MASEVPSASFQQGVDVKLHYDILEELGRGAFSVERKGKHKESGKLFAIKCINKKAVRVEVLEREIAIMQRMRHPHVLCLHEVFDDANMVYIVLDLVTGGELFEKVIKKGHFSERDASVLVRQILEAVEYLHNQGVAHRDLKPENLLCSEDKNIHIYVSDFGLSRLMKDEDLQQMSTQCGSLEYCAPEVLNGELYDKSVDMWSVGVITYILLTGYFPFYDANRDPKVLYEKISTVSYDWEDCPEVSDTGKDFVAHLLVYDPKQRMTADDAMKHPWVKGAKLSGDHLSRSITNLIKSFRKPGRK